MVVINRNLLLISVYIGLYILAYIYNLCSQGNDTLNEVLTKILKKKKKKVLTKMHLLLAVNYI